jgi:hypothetical protein
MFKNSAAFQRVMSRVGKKVIDKFDDFMNKEDGKVAFNESGLTSSPRLKDFRDDPSKKFLPGESTKLEVKDAAPITFNKTNLRQFYNKEIRPLLNEKGITSAEKKSRGQLNDVMQKFFNLKGVYSTNASKKLTSLFDSKSFYDLTPTVKSKTPLRNIQKELAKIKSLDQFLRKTSLDKIKTDTRVKNIVKELRKQRGATDLTVNLGDVKKYALDSIARLSDEENLLKKDLIRIPKQLDILGEVTGPEGGPFPIIPKVKPKIISSETTPLKKIISGGQTGVDESGLIAGKDLGLDIGGTAPKGYKRNNLQNAQVSEKELRTILDESPSSNYKDRTLKNVLDADGTVLFGDMTAGTVQTLNFARTKRKPYIVNPSPEELKDFVKDKNIKTLNVAGNRGTDKGMVFAKKSYDTITEAFGTSKKPVIEPKDTFLQRAKELDDPKFIEEFEQLQREIPDEPIGTTTGRSGKRFRVDEEGALTSEIDPKVRAEMERVQQQQSRTPFFEQDYIDDFPSEFATPEGRAYTVRGAQTAFYNRLKQLDPGFIDEGGGVSGLQPSRINVKLVDDYTKEQLLNLPDEERELLNRAMNIYVDAVDDIKTRRPGVNDADADAFARDVVNSTLLDEGARPSIVKTGDRFYEPEKKLLRKYKSSLKAFKPLRREIPEDDLIGVKEVDAIQLPIKFKKKGGLLGLLKRKKKKFVPKIIKNKKLKKRTQKKPRGVGKALRGYGATSG